MSNKRRALDHFRIRLHHLMSENKYTPDQMAEKMQLAYEMACLSGASEEEIETATTDAFALLGGQCSLS